VGDVAGLMDALPRQGPAGSAVTAVGGYVPNGRVTNDALERRLGLEPGWIERRTGIRARRYALAGDHTADACVRAAYDLAQRYGVDLCDVDLVIAGGMTPDDLVAGTACRVQHALRLERAAAFDLQAACASFVHAIQVANALVSVGNARKVLVVCGELASHIVDPTDRGTVAVFGDGAGAALVEAADRPTFAAHAAATDGRGAPWLYRYDGLRSCDGAGSTSSDPYLRMHGREIFRWVVDALPPFIETLAGRAGVALDAIDAFVPHGANLRMLHTVCERVGLVPERMLTSLEHHGNTGAASIPLAFVHGVTTERLRPGHTVMAVGFGAGLSVAGSVFEWTADPAAVEKPMRPLVAGRG